MQRGEVSVTRPLTDRQQRALLLIHVWGVNSNTERSMPSLARRGLVEKYWEVRHGRRFYDWRITPEGIREAYRLRTERDAAKASQVKP